jgi:hypothetical protein
MIYLFPESRDGQCILVSCVGSTVKLFDKSTGEMLQEYSGHINKDYRLFCTERRSVGFRIRLFFHPGSRIRIVPIPDPGSSSKNLSILTPK